MTNEDKKNLEFVKEFEGKRDKVTMVECNPLLQNVGLSEERQWIDLHEEIYDQCKADLKSKKLL